MTPFEKAFAQARAAGETEFTFNGKRFNTKRADNKPLPAKPGAAPARAAPAAEQSRSPVTDNDADDIQLPVGAGPGPLRKDIMDAIAAQPPEDTRNPMQKAHETVMAGLGHMGNVVHSLVGMGPLEGAEGLNTVPRLQQWGRDLAGENQAMQARHDVQPSPMGAMMGRARSKALRFKD